MRLFSLKTSYLSYFHELSNILGGYGHLRKWVGMLGFFLGGGGMFVRGGLLLDGGGWDGSVLGWCV
jgi:hypothetical protein